MTSNRNKPTSIRLFQSPEQACSYLPDRASSSLFVDPALSLNPGFYSQLLQNGFRRSGGYVYRPHCPSCRACKATRIPVNEFRPRRNQRRALQANQAVTITPADAVFKQEHYELYQRYTASRHPDGEMSQSSPEQYMDFLTAPWCQTEFIEFRERDVLVAVAVTDVMPDALSAVYTFFEPGFQHRSPGVFAILQQIAIAANRGLPWLYLGYWIEESRKMRYKTDFRPIEIRLEQGWENFKPGMTVE